MGTRVFGYLLLLIFVSKVHTLLRKPIPLDLLEEILVQKAYGNCTKFTSFTRDNYDRIGAAQRANLDQLSLVHYVWSEQIVHKLSTAHITIPASSKFDMNKPMAIFSHGYLATNIYPIATPILNNLQATGDVNVFLYDHKPFTADTYYNASANTRIAGEALGEALSKLYANGVIGFHLMGVSLGAHTSGFAGKKFTELTSELIDRISGIDPAGPCFYEVSSDFRLDPSDAAFVDVIHTDMHAYGIAKSIGHVDFYPNGGENMLGCFITQCSHMIAGVYYGESIASKDFLAVKCPDWKTFKSGECANNQRAVMGYWTDTSARGDYYLFVDVFSKFALGEEGIAKPGFNIRKYL